MKFSSLATLEVVILTSFQSMPLKNFVNSGSGNGLVPLSNMSLAKPMLVYCQMGPKKPTKSSSEPMTI